MWLSLRYTALLHQTDALLHHTAALLHQTHGPLHHTAALLHQTNVCLQHVAALHFMFCTLFGCTFLFFLEPMSTSNHPCQSNVLLRDTLDPPLTHPI